MWLTLCSRNWLISAALHLIPKSVKIIELASYATHSSKSTCLCDDSDDTEPVSGQVQFSFLLPCTHLPCSHIPSTPSLLPILCPHSFLPTSSLSLPNLPPSILPSKFSTLICLALLSSSATSLSNSYCPPVSFLSLTPLPNVCSLRPHLLCSVWSSLTESIQPSADKSGQRLTRQFIIHCLLTTFPVLVNTFFLYCQMLSTFHTFTTLLSNPIFFSFSILHSIQPGSHLNLVKGLLCYG